jgi:hypothetical protein
MSEMKFRERMLRARGEVQVVERLSRKHGEERKERRREGREEKGREGEREREREKERTKKERKKKERKEGRKRERERKCCLYPTNVHLLSKQPFPLFSGSVLERPLLSRIDWRTRLCSCQTESITAEPGLTGDDFLALVKQGPRRFFAGVSLEPNEPQGKEQLE